MNIIEKTRKVLLRNKLDINGNIVERKKVNYQFWQKEINVGDQISIVIAKHLCENKGIEFDKQVTHTQLVLGLGSIIGMSYGDATVWGSGINLAKNIHRLYKGKTFVKYDIRALRGPITKSIMEKAGYVCKDIPLGDPAVLLPLVYNTNDTEKKYDVSLIQHYSYNSSLNDINGCHIINVKTNDYQQFVKEVVASKKIISSSLHGIIISEAYGVPAVFCNEEGHMDTEILKYYDWYYATGRRSVVSATSVKEAKEIKPMPIPDLRKMQNDLIGSFPYDLWD